MMIRRLIPSFALLLAGCATAQGDGRAYPSLAKRPIESPNYGVVAAPAPAPVIDPAADAEPARLLKQALAGDAAFDSAYGAAQAKARAASSAGPMSEAWVEAQVALSALESARNDSVFALASLDTLYIERADALSAGKPGLGMEAVDSARADALGIVDDQNDRLDALKALLRQP